MWWPIYTVKAKTAGNKLTSSWALILSIVWPWATFFFLSSSNIVSCCRSHCSSTFLLWFSTLVIIKKHQSASLPIHNVHHNVVCWLLCYRCWNSAEVGFLLQFSSSLSNSVCCPCLSCSSYPTEITIKERNIPPGEDWRSWPYLGFCWTTCDAKVWSRPAAWNGSFEPVQWGNLWLHTRSPRQPQSGGAFKENILPINLMLLTTDANAGVSKKLFYRTQQTPSCKDTTETGTLKLVSCLRADCDSVSICCWMEWLKALPSTSCAWFWRSSVPVSSSDKNSCW